MPDIAMCTNDECPLKDSCYRSIAEPSEFMQSYSSFQYEEEDECSYYWEVEVKE